jgi:uncharacterized protein
VIECLWRYPVKSAQGESVERLFLGLDGVAFDRVWACIASDGVVVSAKQPRRWGRLLQVQASVADPDGAVVWLDIPDAEPVRAGTAEADQALSTWLGTSVRLTREVPENARLHRLLPRHPDLVPSWLADSAPGEELVTGITGARPGGRFLDFGPVHLVTESELAELATDAGEEADVRRFRPNLVVSTDRAPAPGDVLQVADGPRLRVLVPTPRCAMPGASQRGLADAPQLMRAIGRRRQDIPGIGRAACVGSYAEVLRPGHAAVGDTVVVA